MRIYVWIIALAALLAGPAAAERRVALVIGNGAYAKVPQLANPTNDAGAMEALLKGAGFDKVLRADNLGTAQMRRALRDFSDEVADADIAVVFYAGHGMEMNGINYLIPVDAVLERDIDVADEAVSLDRVNQVLEQAKRLRLVILDACRDNPFVRSMRRTLAGRAIGRGLAPVEVATTDTLIAYAAKAGSTAADGDGSNSPYTAAILKHLATPGLDVRLALGRVRDEVLRTTSRRQEPFVYGSLGGAEIPLIAAPRQPVVPSPPFAGGVTVSAAAEAWDRIKETSDATVLEAFITRFGDTFFGDLAKSRLAVLRQEQPRVSLLQKQEEGSQPAIRVDRSYGSGWPSAIAALPDGGVLIAKLVEEKSDRIAGLERLDRHGHRVWLKTFARRVFFPSASITLEPEGDATVLGQGWQEGVPPKPTSDWMLRIGLDGSVKSDVLIGGPQGQFLRRSATAGGGNIAVFGDDFHHTAIFNQRLFLFDRTGRLLVQREVSAGMDTAQLVTSMPGGGFVTAWNFAEEPLKLGKPTVALYDTAGTQLWRKQVTGAGTGQVAALAAFPDGRLAVAGEITSARATRDPLAWVSLLNADGSIKAETLVGPYAAAFLMAIAPMPDGGVVVAGCAEHGDVKDQLDPWFVRLDASGKVMREIKRKRTNGGTVHALVALPNGSVAATGISGNQCGFISGVDWGADTWVEIIPPADLGPER